MPIKISIIEDDSRFRESMAVLLSGVDGLRFLSAYPNAEVALQEIPKDWPDVLLVDINLPKVSGITCVARLKAMRRNLQVLMLTAYVDNDQIFDSLKAGASGYLIKKTPVAEIIEAITDVHAGGSPMSNVIARKIVQSFQEERTSDETKDLSPREYEILRHLAKGLQYREIGELLKISALTVRTHMHNIYEKLHVKSQTEAVIKFLGKKE